MTVNGKEVGFRYTTGINIWFSEYVNEHPETAIATVYVKLANLMSEAYARTNGGESLTEEELLDMDYAAFTKVRKEIEAVMKVDAQTTVAVKEPKGKKTKSEKQS